MFEQDDDRTGTPGADAGTTELEDRDDATGADGSDDSADGAPDSADDGGTAEGTSGKDYRKLAKELGTQLQDTQQRLKAIEDAQRRQPSATGMQPQATPDADKAAEQFAVDIALENEMLAGSPITPEHVKASARLSRARAQLAFHQGAETGRKLELTSVPEADRAHVDRLMRAGMSRADATEFVNEVRGPKSQPKDTTKDDAAEVRKAAARAHVAASPDTTRRALTASDVAGRIKQSEFDAKLARFDTSDPEQFRKKQELAAKYRGKVVPG